MDPDRMPPRDPAQPASVYGPAAGRLPEPLLGQVTDIAERLAEAPGVCAVLLLGSAARGELVTARLDGRLEVFGDIELMAVTARRLRSSDRSRLATDVHDWGAGLGYGSALFHAEVLFRERSRLGSMPPLVFTHELATNGLLLAGTDVRSEIRKVTIDSLDRRNTHEIAFKRLWALAEAIPEAWVKRWPMGELDARSLGVACARNALDVPTVLLPEAGLLGASYEERVEMWQSRDDLPFRPELDRALGEDSAAYFRSCLLARRTAEAGDDPARGHQLVTRALIGTLAWLLHPGFASTAEHTLSQIAEYGGDVFNERPISIGEVVGRFRSARRVAGERGLRGALGWSVADKKGRLCAAAGFLHLALAAWMSDEAAAASRLLERVPAVVAGPWKPPASDPESFAESWLASRVWLGRAFWHTVRLGDPLARRRMEEALGRSW